MPRKSPFLDLWLLFEESLFPSDVSDDWVCFFSEEFFVFELFERPNLEFLRVDLLLVNEVDFDLFERRRRSL